MTAGERLLSVIRYYHLTQAQFGKAIGLTRGAVSSIIHGKASLSRKNAKLVCVAFPEISEEWLFSGIGDMLNAPADDVESLIARMDTSPAVRTLLSVWAQLDEPSQRVLERFVEDYVSAYRARCNSKLSE